MQKRQRSLENIHEAFHVPGPGPYALSHSVGCLPRESAVAFDETFLGSWARQGGEAWPLWLKVIDKFRRELAAVFGGAADEYCPQTNLSSGLTKILSALPPPKAGKQTLVAAEDSFPSLGFVLQQAERWNYKLELIGRDRSPADLETWAAALTPGTCAALVTHVHSNTGEVAPVAEIGRFCAERNILCIVDVAQSAGILPMSFPDLHADIVLGSCVKWLCGGPGAGFMWIRKDLIAGLEPVDVGWFSHEDPFEFDIHSFRYAPDARRFWGGTPSVEPFLFGGAGLMFLREVGIPAIFSHNRKLIQAFLDELPPDARPPVQVDRMGGTLCIPAGDSLEPIRTALSAAQVRFDTRGDIIRLSFHICNRLEDAITVGRAWAEGSRK